MDTCRVVSVLAVMAMIAGAVLAIFLYWGDRRRKRQRIKPVVSLEDLERYQGKHVMTDGYGGPVVAAGDCIEDMAADVAAFDDEIRQRLVYAYLPRKDEAMIDG